MITKFFEATQGLNWGKFVVAWFTPQELNVKSEIDPGRSLIRARGWTENHVWVCDLQTGEGAFFKLGGHAKSDLDNHKIWVCPMFLPFLTWLYEQVVHGKKIERLPQTVTFSKEDAPFDFAGYRRSGPEGAEG